MGGEEGEQGGETGLAGCAVVDVQEGVMAVGPFHHGTARVNVCRWLRSTPSNERANPSHALRQVCTWANVKCVRPAFNIEAGKSWWAMAFRQSFISSRAACRAEF